MSFANNIQKLNIITFLRNLFFISGVLIPFFTDWGKISFWQIMLLQSWFIFWIFILEIPTGAVADYLNRKLSIILSCAIGVVGIFIYTTYPNFYIFLLGEWLFALSVALISGADEAMVYDTLKALNQTTESKRSFGTFFSYKMIALTVSAPIGSFIASSWGLTYAFRLMALPLIIAFLVALTLKEPPRLSKEKESERYLKLVTGGLKYLYQHKILKLFIIDSIPIAAFAFMIIWLYQPLLQKLNVPIGYFGWVHAVLCLAQILVLTNFSRLEKWFRGKQRFLKWSALFTGLSFIILSASFNWLIATIFILVAGAFGLTRDRLFSNYMHKHIESDNRATVISGVSMLKTLLQGIIYLLVGLIGAWSINYTFLFVGLAIITLALLSQTEEKHFID